MAYIILVPAMPRHYKRTTRRISPALIEEAVKCINEKGVPLRQVSRDLNIPRTTLQRYLSDAKANAVNGVDTNYNKGAARNKVFSVQLEKELEQYLLQASRHLHGLTKSNLRDLAYEYAKENNCKYPKSWDDNQKAGMDWVDSFMSRHKGLTIRKPQATSLSRATSFNRHNLNMFYDNLETVLVRYKFSPNAIWNMDETSVSTAHRPPKVIADKTVKQVGQITSAERGIMCTMVGAVNAQGNFMPPMIIFPRVNFKDYMIAGAPTGTTGAANPSGWISREIFVSWLKQFISHTRASKDNPVMLLLDNHDSHVSIAAIETARKYGVVMVSFPPHCTHRLQPLDIAVYSPFKRSFFDACNGWQISNPGRTLTIYNMAELITIAFPAAFTPRNITSGFRAPGIFPYNRNIFTDDDLASSYVTDRPDETEPSATPATTPLPSVSTPSTSAVVATAVVTPEQIRPHAKAGPRKKSRRGRTRQAAILTLTPQKSATEETGSPVPLPVKRRRSKRKDDTSDSESESDEPVVLEDNTSDEEPECGSPVEDANSTIKTGDYVVVKFAGKKTIKHYVGLVLTQDALETQVTFFKRNGQHYVSPDQPDISFVDSSDIVLKLPEPSFIGAGSRAGAKISFGVDLSRFSNM